MSRVNARCTECKHVLLMHESEPPYRCVAEDCDCQGFSYIPSESAPASPPLPSTKVLVSRSLMEGLRGFMNRRFDRDRLANYQQHFIREIDRECGEPSDEPTAAPLPPTPSEPLRILNDLQKAAHSFLLQHREIVGGVPMVSGSGAIALKLAIEAARELLAKSESRVEAPAPLPSPNWVVMCPRCKATWVQGRVSDEFMRMHVEYCHGGEPSAAPSPTLPRQLRTTCGVCEKEYVDGKHECAVKLTELEKVILNADMVSACDHYCCGMNPSQCRAKSMAAYFSEHYKAPSPTAAEGERPRQQYDDGFLLYLEAIGKSYTPEEMSDALLVTIAKEGYHMGKTAAKREEILCGLSTSMSSATGDSAAVVAVPTNAERAKTNERADRGSVQTALPLAQKFMDFFEAQYALRGLAFDFDQLQNIRAVALNSFSAFWRMYEQTAPTPLSAEELAPLLAKQDGRDKITWEDVRSADDVCSLPGVAVVRK